MIELAQWLQGWPILGYFPVWFLIVVSASVFAGVSLAVIAVAALVEVWLERKVSAHMQCRLGPMHTGWHGILQTAADGLKLFIKEDVIPAMADKPLYILAPGIVFSGALLSWVALPLGPGWIPADFNIGMLYLLATSSLVAIGIIMAGWASHSKWTLYGAMRTAAQFLSYEIPTALHILPPVLLAGSLNLTAIVDGQAEGFLGLGGWYIFNPFCFIAFVAYYISSLAETGRIPFDLPESEAELVAGAFTEYSGIRYAFFYMAEYADLFVVSAIGSLLFLGGWHGPFGLHGGVIYLAKVVTLILLAMWLRWTLPRLRIDQLMATCWKFLIPLGLINILLISLWVALVG